MNFNQIINMFMRLFMRKIMSRGIDAGINYASKRPGSAQNDNDPDAQLTPQERKSARAAKQTARRAKQTAKLARRLGRF